MYFHTKRYDNFREAFNDAAAAIEGSLRMQDHLVLHVKMPLKLTS